MFRKLTILLCLMSFSPVAAGAQDVALLVNAQPAAERAAAAGDSAAAPQQAKELNLSLPAKKEAATVMAANEVQGAPAGESARKSHSGMTFGDFVDVHFGGYRWLYWVGAVAAIVVLHVTAFNHHD
jgi:hypothetical protein